MKFIQKKAIIGTTRVIEGFLWLPKFIDGEWRWLEFSRWKDKALYSNHRYTFGHNPLPTTEPILNFKWHHVEWLDGGTHDDTDWPRE